MKHYSEEVVFKTLLSIPSVNGVDDEREIANFIAEYLKDCKVNVSVREIDQSMRMSLRTGRKSKENGVWNGHLDTVPLWKTFTMEYRSGRSSQEKRMYLCKRGKRYEKRS